jgi:hypothetical protein
MPIVANCRIILSSSNHSLTTEILNVVKETVIKRFGEKAIVFSGVELEATESGLYFAHIYLNLEKPLNDYFNIPEKSTIKLREVGKDADSR